MQSIGIDLLRHRQAVERVVVEEVSAILWVLLGKRSCFVVDAELKIEID